MKDAMFAIIKATEGTGYIDPNVSTNYEDAVAAGLLTGFYHYARPEYGNTPEMEAAHFVDVVKDYIGYSVFVLDYEGSAHKYGAEWASKWLSMVYKLTGVRPMIYLSGSTVKYYTELAEQDYGLWIASWTSEAKRNEYVTGWDTWAMWQYTNTPFDCDYFNGNEGQFMLYAAQDEEWLESQLPSRPETGTGHCGCCCKGE